MTHSLDFPLIRATALANAESVCRRILPGGRAAGHEFVALNPNRADRSPGSFKVNLRSGRWSDFATGEGGGDLISLVAWRYGLRQAEAARQLAHLLNITKEARP